MADRDDGNPNGAPGSGVVVPLRLYKTVTVFTTLLAMIGFVGGFMLLDRATRNARAPLSQVDPVLAGIGLFLLVASSAIWIYGTRFRAPGMGNPKDDADEGGDDG